MKFLKKVETGEATTSLLTGLRCTTRYHNMYYMYNTYDWYYNNDDIIIGIANLKVLDENFHVEDDWCFLLTCIICDVVKNRVNCRIVVTKILYDV